MTDDEVIRAVRWRLGVPVYASDDQLWFQLMQMTASEQQRRNIARALGDMFERAVLLKLQVRCHVRTHERDLVDRFLEVTKDGRSAIDLTRKLKEIVYPDASHYTPHPPKPPSQRIVVKQAISDVVEGGATFPNKSNLQPPMVKQARGEPIMQKPPK